MKKILVLINLLVLVLTGCMPSEEGLVSKPEDIYSQVGFGSYASINEEGIATITYAGVGLNEANQIVSMMIDQIDIDVNNSDNSTVSKRLLGNCYGIGFESTKGDWATQMLAFENFIIGKKYLLDTLKEEQLVVMQDEIRAAEGSDLSAGCTIELTGQVYALENALENIVEIENGAYYTLGQYTDIHMNTSTHTVSLCLIARDYLNTIQESYVEEYVIKDGTVISKSEQDNSSKAQYDFLEDYMNGKRVEDIINIEMYDKGDGIHNSLPMADSDLSEGYNMNIGPFIKALEGYMLGVSNVCK